MNPFAALDATAQAALVHDGTASPTELVQAAIDAAEALNPDLNAIIHPRYERALAEAAAVDPSAPFAGVPLVVKDLDGTLAGEPYHAGTRHLRDANYVADVTSWTFERLQAAGFVIIGKTNTPEFGLVPTTEPLAYGPSRNPWNTGHSTGGSSGGSAASVAAGIVPVGHAGDGGGSIRIPASECGLVGLKPTRARVTLGPAETESWGGLVSRLVVTRTMRDTAAVLDIVGRPGVGDPYGVATPVRPYVDELSSAPARLRIGVDYGAADGTPVDPEVVAAVRRTADLLASMGHEVSEAAPSQLGDEAFFATMSGYFLTAYPVWVAQSVDQLGALTGTPATADSVEPLTWSLAETGRLVSGIDFANATEGMRVLSREIQQWWNDFDVLITATIPELPPTLGQFGAEPDNPLAGVFRATPIVANTMPFNITGQPAMSLPIDVSASGLPIGVQLVSGFGRDDLLVALGAQLEAAAPWADRRPGVWAGA
ncbi:MAG: amidase [Acidimicrobiales bacterium]